MEKQTQMALLDLEKRKTTFDEVSLGYNIEEAKKEAERCLNCKNQPCKTACPVKIDIAGFINCVKDGDVDTALEVINKSNTLPAICGRVCPQESQCESKCIRGIKDEPVAIGKLERFVADNGKLEIDVKEKNHHKVAVIGSGPAGLACAGELVKNGINVTVYESWHRAGGVLTYGIPEFRLPKTVVEKQINKLVDQGVKFELNTLIGRTITMEQLQEDFDAIFIGSGAGLPNFMKVDGEELNGCYVANDFLVRINLMKAHDKGYDTPVFLGKNVAIIGGGNVAMDSARVAKRLGANVCIYYRRGEEDMPARAEEIRHAKEEGIEFCLHVAPVRLIGENKWLKQIELVKTEIIDGRVKEIAGTNLFVEADTLISCIGQSPNPLLKQCFDKLEVKENGAVIVNEEMETNVENIYAGGDAVLGAATVILAMGHGKKAGQNIIKKLS